MDCSIYRELLEAHTSVDSHKRDKLIRIYAQVPSVPKLKATRAALAALKTALNRRNDALLQPTAIRVWLDAKRLG